MVTSVANSTSSSELSRDQFLTLFAKQLQYQDPTSPMDTDNFLQQLAQFHRTVGRVCSIERIRFQVRKNSHRVLK